MTTSISIAGLGDSDFQVLMLKDVKDFIKQIKDICNNRSGYRSVGMGALINEIDKLAGDKLL